ncbi:MAG TPA: ECF transporter S component [Thermoanaerobacterales bacterium]|nr:ECF transporter S component [Thermoanaerobacterales bacterium]
MSPFQWFIRRFSMFDLAVMALMSALGIATKPVIVPLAHIITGPLYIPGGVIAGGFYMMWIVLGTAIVHKKGAGTLIGLVQAILMLVLGVYGTHGALSLITYSLPGLAVDLAMLMAGKWAYEMAGLFLAGIMANLTGTFLSSLVFFRLPLIPLLLSLSAASLSGGLGGIIAFQMTRQLIKFEEGGGNEK